MPFARVASDDLFLVSQARQAKSKSRFNWPIKQRPTATGTGGAVASEHPAASQAALDILKRGGNAVDAAIAAAAVQGVTRPYSGGVGGGGMMLIYLAKEKRFVAIDHREMAPRSFGAHSFLNAKGNVLPANVRQSSGAAAGVPGAVMAWEEALTAYGTMSMRQVLRPAIAVAEKGFAVDDNYVRETTENAPRFRMFSSSRKLFLTHKGRVPKSGTTVRNRDLARTYRLIAKHGSSAFYEGEIAEAIVDTVNRPPTVSKRPFPVKAGDMSLADLANYETMTTDPIKVSYRGYDVYGMPPPSSGSTTIGEALNILERYNLSKMPRDKAWHYYIEASRHAFADRNKYLGDPTLVDIPLSGLLSKGYAAERRQKIGRRASKGIIRPGNPWPYVKPARWPTPEMDEDEHLFFRHYAAAHAVSMPLAGTVSTLFAASRGTDSVLSAGGQTGGQIATTPFACIRGEDRWDMARDSTGSEERNDLTLRHIGSEDTSLGTAGYMLTANRGGYNPDKQSTIHLSVADKDGNIVSYTSTIVTIGGNGIVVPGYGFLLNNALSAHVPLNRKQGEPNAPEPGMRPLSSMSPTIVMKDGQPVLTVGAPGSGTIITTVLQIVISYLDFEMSLPQAVAAPRVSQMNISTDSTTVEPAFTKDKTYRKLKKRGHKFSVSTLKQGIGAATAIAFSPSGLVQAVAEPVRRGGGSAMVEHPIKTLKTDSKKKKKKKGNTSANKGKKGKEKQRKSER